MVVYVYISLLFFFKQKTAYELCISDWSSDVCSSDLRFPLRLHIGEFPGQLHPKRGGGIFLGRGLRQSTKRFDARIGGGRIPGIKSSLNFARSRAKGNTQRKIGRLRLFLFGKRRRRSRDGE